MAALRGGVVYARAQLLGKGGSGGGVGHERSGGVVGCGRLHCDIDENEFSLRVVVVVALVEIGRASCRERVFLSV